MKQAFYDVHYVKADGYGLVIGGFYSREEAEICSTEENDFTASATFLRIDRRLEEITPEDLLRTACVLCGSPICYYKSSWREVGVSPDLGRRACITHPCPPGFRYYTDG